MTLPLGRLAALFVVGLVVAGCGPALLAPDPHPVADLSGSWILDRAASDDAAKMIAASLPKPKPLRPLSMQGGPLDGVSGGAPAPSGGDRGSGQRGERGRGGHSRDDPGQSRPQEPSEAMSSLGHVRPGEFVAAFVAPPARLDVLQAPARIELGTVARRRAFGPGDPDALNVTDRYGSRAVRAGWTADALVVNSVDGNRLRVVEHYRLTADDRLQSTVEFSARGLKSLTVHSVYRRANAAELAVPFADGPPPPMPR